MAAFASRAAIVTMCVRVPASASLRLHALSDGSRFPAAANPPKVTDMTEFATPDQLYTHDLEFAQGSQWGAVVLQLAVGARSEASYMRDPEAIRCAETGYSPVDIYLGKRQYTDDQLGKLDGPGRDIVDFNYEWTKRTPKARLSKRQRSKLRKASRAAKRKGIAFNEAEFISVTLIEVS